MIGLYNFKNHSSLHNVKVSGESASADMKAAEEVLEILDKLTVDQILNMDKHSLFWK